MVDWLNGSERLSINITNQTTYNPYGCIYSSKPFQIAILSVIMIWALIGNVLVVAVYYKTRTMRTTVYRLIVNMAISDLLIPLLYLPPLISAALNSDNRWLLGGALGSGFCKFIFFAWQVSRLVSIFSMMVIAVDRFQAILFPMKPSLISPKGCRFIITVVWIASVAFGAHLFYAVRLVSRDTKLYCVFQWEPESYTSEALLITLVSLMCVNSVSALVLTVLYSSIVVFLYRQKNRLHLDSEVIKKRAKTNQKITCMLLIIVIVFYAVWSPFNVQIFLYFLKPEGVFQCQGVTFGLQLMYPAVNPVVYYIFNNSYRQGFRDLLCCQWFCVNKCNNCFRSSVAAQCENNAVQDEGQVHDVIENNENQGQR